MTTDEAVYALEVCRTRERAAAIYARALRDPFGIKWVTLNRTILARWSMSGLKWIKARAWKMAQADGPIADEGLHLA